jgi:hypothetical protein
MVASENYRILSESDIADVLSHSSAQRKREAITDVQVFQNRTLKKGQEIC